jgi:hypothetical protein
MKNYKKDKVSIGCSKEEEKKRLEAIAQFQMGALDRFADDSFCSSFSKGCSR